MIDLDKLVDISFKGIRRASVFLSFGISSSKDRNLKDYELSRESAFRIMPDNLNDGQISNLKTHYGDWIISCGLRELIETFSVYLSRIYEVCLGASIHKKVIQCEDPDSKIKSYGWKGIEKQLNKLRNEFSVETSKEKYIKSINQARNCITHRRGIVGPEDLRGESSLKISWWALDAHIDTPDGEKILFNPPYPKDGILLKDGGMFSVTVVEREREYQVGHVIKLSPTDLSEICMIMTVSTQEILSTTVNYLKSIGIKVNRTEQIKD